MPFPRDNIHNSTTPPQTVNMISPDQSINAVIDDENDVAYYMDVAFTKEEIARYQREWSARCAASLYPYKFVEMATQVTSPSSSIQTSKIPSLLEIQTKIPSLMTIQTRIPILMSLQFNGKRF